MSTAGMVSSASAAHAAPSLVRSPKSSTPPPEWEIDLANDYVADIAREAREAAPLPEYWDDFTPPDLYSEHAANESGAGKFLKVNCEMWRAVERTEEGALYTPLLPDRALWRATAVTEGRAKMKPPVQTGDRWTERLTARGKKAIEDASLYMHRCGAGFGTFLTLTFTPEWRAQIEAWDRAPRTDEDRRTIGNLVTEFLNVMQQRRRQGLTFSGHYRRAGKKKRTPEGAEYTPIKWREKFKIRGQGKPFEFVWVVENPQNENGENNPHIHVLLNWRVKIDQFHAWSAWIERTWGKGFAKLERLRKPAAAAAYMAKAAGYLAKGTDGKQGPVRGNRYSVSVNARAPKARTVGWYNAEWVYNVIKEAMQTARENWPRGLWFTAHGFGARTRKTWGALWSALKADGIKIQPAPDSLHLARFKNAAIKYMRRVFDPFRQAANSLFEQLETNSGDYPAPLSLDEFERMTATGGMA